MSGELKAMGEVVIKRKVGQNGKLFGTITHKQIMEEVKSKTGGKGKEGFPHVCVQTLLILAQNPCADLFPLAGNPAEISGIRTHSVLTNACVLTSD
jgi:hypothetical protein